MSTQDDLLALDENEQVLVTVKRHPIGLVGIYATAALGVAAALIMLYVSVSNNDFPLGLSNFGYGILFGSVIATMALFATVATHVYKTNELVITNENIIQVLQYSLLSRQVSQLNLAKIQDVSVDQFGLASTFLDYGTIEIETAGEASNFRFEYAPKPNITAKIIIEAHEDYMRRGKSGHHTYDL